MPKVSLLNSKSFECKPGQTLLEAAHEQLIALDYSCRAGRCGVCKAQVLKGSTVAIRLEECLTQEDVSANIVLTCCRSAVTDVFLNIEELGGLTRLEKKTLPCRVDSISLVANDVIEVTLRTPHSSHLSYLPGQHIQVIGKDGLRRSYSIANAPRSNGKLTLHIRRVLRGKMSRYWFDEAKVNDLLRLEGPFGTFHFRPSRASNLVFLATGTGMAPIRAMLEQLTANSEGHTYSHIHVYWGARTEDDFYWTPYLPALPLRFIPVLSRPTNGTGERVYIQDIALTDKIPLEDTVVYACGSTFMIASARRAFVQAGLSPKSFYADAFLDSS